MKKIISFVVIIGIIAAVNGFIMLFTTQIEPREPGDYLYITSGMEMSEFKEKIKSHQSQVSIYTLPWVMRLMRFTDRQLKPGRYSWEEPLSNVDLLRLIRSGNQDPIDVVIFNGERIEDVAGIASKYLEADSLSFLRYFNDYTNQNDNGYNSDNILSLFIPNTYEMYWNCDPECFIDRMIKEHDKFWTKEKLELINKIGLSPAEAYVMASIVEKESQEESERKRIAGVYLNRLKKGMLLQADPTVVFAMGEKGLRRVLTKHLAFDSPYNTYLYPGLPPGPIAMPSLSSLAAAIAPESHNYLYFCAKPGYDGRHQFASSLNEHNRNASIYQSWLNKEKIY